ncbi:MAG: Hpt domain-containing protein [Candidatus Rokubacteria bacterium]|nr:Hpt domain-containing protein [Candidatus Rokubacteria bacterium]
MSTAADAELLGIFLLEAWDTIAAVEAALERWASAPALGVPEITPLTIVAHRLKGAAGLHGFPGVSALAAEMERTLVALPSREPRALAAGLGTLTTLSAGLKPIFDDIAATGREDGDAIAALRAPSPDGAAPAAPPAAAGPDGPAEPPSAPASPREIVARFLGEHPDVAAFFVPEASEQLEAIAGCLLALEGRHGDGAGTPVDALATIFRAAHTLKGAAYTVGCTPVGDAAHEIEDALAPIQSDRETLTPARIQWLFEAVDGLRAVLGLGADRVGRAAPAAEAATVARPSAAAPTPPPPARSTIRVTVARLDGLMRLAGELATARSRLDHRLLEFERLLGGLRNGRGRVARTVGEFEAQYLDSHPIPPGIEGRHEFPGPPRALGVSGAPGAPEPIDPGLEDLELDRHDDVNILARRMSELSADLGEVELDFAALLRTLREDAGRIQRLVADMRHAVAGARKLPLAGLFGRVARQVREVARSTGKLVELETLGETVEVDTAIVDAIAEALLHLVQNAIAHGIEPPHVRRARGKPEQGTVRVSAAMEGALLALSVEDDGAGLDVARIRAAAVAQGRVTGSATLSGADVTSLIFAPGLSTATAVTATAGRGVGLDAVQATVHRLNGEVTADSRSGEGTRFTLRLPVALVMSDALLVRVGAHTFAMPLVAVRRVARARSQDLEHDAGRETLHVEGEPVELLRLDGMLGIAAPEHDAARPVLVLKGPRRLGIVVDALLGQQETVTQPLGPVLAGLGPFSGAAISPDGRVVLVLDAAAIAAAGPASSRPPAGAAEPVLVPGETPRRVLVVDDSPSVRKVVGGLLAHAGLEVLTAADGEEALQVLARGSVDVVVTDLEMPRLNGYELIADLAHRPSTRDVPVVALTARVGERHVALARRLGVEHILAKPVDGAALVGLVRSLSRPILETA